MILGLFLVLEASWGWVSGAVAAPIHSRVVTKVPAVVPASEPSISDVLEFGSPTPSRVPIGCGGLIDSRVLARVLGLPASTIALAPRRALYWLEDAAAAQAGLLTCAWEGSVDDASGQTLGATMSIQVLQNAHDEFHAYGQSYRSLEDGWEKEYPEEPRVVSDLIGTDSLLSCDLSGASAPFPYQSCWGSLEVSGYWVEFQVSSRRPYSSGIEAQTALGVLVGETLRRELNAAGPPLAENTLPFGTVGAWDSCAALEGAGELQRLAGSPTLTFRREYSGVEFNIGLAALPQSPYQTCYWDQSAFPDEEHYFYACDDCELPEDYVEPPVIPEEMASITVSMLPGGEWAWYELKDQRPSMDLEDISLIGAGDAISACEAPSYGWCEIDALVGHSVVRIEFGYSGEESETLDLTPRALQIMRYVINRLAD